MKDNPQKVSLSEKERIFFDQRAELYDNIIISTSPVGMDRIKRRALSIIQNAELKEGMTVLELGCGTGEYTKEFAEGKLQLVSLDISPEMIKLTRSKVGSSVKYVVSNAEQLPFKDGVFDAVVGNAILHHFPDLSTALQEVRRTKTQQAKVVFREPNLYNPAKFFVFGIPILRPFRKDRWSPSEKVFSRSFIKKILKKTGYSVLNIEYAGLVGSRCPSRITNFLYWIEGWFSKIPIFNALLGSMIIRAE
ncbi:MAG: methyltransferase domain-containing protein [Candidatus Aegiribacteria sp.]|nr:methyltransferase domain-containing protein [Candidatus Aegiribacteria sp.]